MKRLLLALAFLAAAVPAMACINTYGTDLRGQMVESSDMPESLVDHLTEHRGAWYWRGERAKRVLKLDGASLEQRNDYAAVLLHLGEIKTALAILVQIEQTRPGLYATATNLGTAYELAGKNEHALSWIRAGIRRNPASHEASEWLHVSILEAKLAMAKDPNWLRTHSVLGLDFGAGPVPKMPARFPRGNAGEQLDAVDTSDAIRAQLHERMQFVKAPDAIVGDLLFDFGNLLMLTNTMENATAVYQLALRYGTLHEPVARKRLAHARAVIKRAQ